MPDIQPGQRWISDTELQLGLGTVTAVEARTVTIAFPATGESRVYARDGAPLTRVSLTQGDTINTQSGDRVTIESIREANGLLVYTGTTNDGRAVTVPEAELDHHIRLSRPTERLFSGQIDSDRLFELRYQTLLHRNRLAHSDLYGLTGGRTSLIPHQLYIAHEVASRYAPRVLLADEVGLGKTIEAGLILHQQLLTERAHRVLILVPETLVHQWLVEMLRRFDLRFSVFDESRCQAIAEGEEHTNPFETEQLVLCSIGFLREHPARVEQALVADWDLLVVDEAHHLQWSPDDVSEEYRIVEQLAAATRGVLLLTATPEQLGKESHFARLRLLDPDRFADFERFVEEEQHYEPVARAVEQLLGTEPLHDDTRTTLATTLEEGDNRQWLEQADSDDAETRTQARRQLIDHLLDRHGTGRILYRNTRAAVQGFPERVVHPAPLPMPGVYTDCLKEFAAVGLSQPQLLLCPELLYQAAGEEGQTPWTEIDPRADWLVERLDQLGQDKVLVIAASADTALDLADYLRTEHGLHAAVFHEGMSIIERDRAAAFFADPEGSRVLICSEIGSEGRNFQFAHHLVLFDLPLNPDLLEQRIGRLDRIGQTTTIQIHAPYLAGSAQEVMFHWYHEGLSAFEHTCPAGHSVYVQVEGELLDALHKLNDTGANAPLIETTRALHSQMNEALHRGRDRLLEYNSCRPGPAEELKARGEKMDRESSGLREYMDQVFDCFGIDSEEHSRNSIIIRPGEHVQAVYPGLTEDGMTLTFDRVTALAREDLPFLTWEHPLASWGMDMVLGAETGNTAFTVIEHKGLQPGTLMLEAVYLLESASSETLQSSRYLPPTTLRVLIDQQGRDLSEALGHDWLRQARKPVETETAQQIVRSQVAVLKQLVSHAGDLARQRTPALLAEARRHAEDTLLGEINRLKALRRFNPNIRDEEIGFFESQWQAVTAILEATEPRLEAVRVVVAT